ncbi:MAG: GNAT family N-acetyltransferase [Bacteroidota bacterium]
MIQFVIRSAKESDLKSIVRLLLRIWKEQYSSFLPVSFLDKMNFNQQLKRHQTYLSKGNTYLIAENAQKDLLGFCSFGENRDSFPKAKWELYTLYVAPEQQRKGVGSKLIKEVLRKLEKEDKMAVWVMKANPFRHFYEKRGFRWVGERNVNFGEFEVAHWVMTRTKQDE